jgi:hypothetical protein
MDIDGHPTAQLNQISMYYDGLTPVLHCTFFTKWLNSGIHQEYYNFLEFIKKYFCKSLCVTPSEDICDSYFV